ncbi:hypothetical protein D7X33_20940 [Butyricicoccus sp. 1XD8-22]|nr:hypothetical protein D7X33_20940 [Butyricicoccus sp. 1XD8-22]
MSKYKLNKPVPYNQTEEFKDSIKKATNNYAYSPSSKKFSSKTKIQSPLIRYNLDDINRWLQNPVQFEEHLRKLSNYLYDNHPTYKLIVRYIALLPQYAWTLTIDTSSGNKDKIKKNYIKVLNQIEKMNLRYELVKASLVAYKNDFFFGYEIETKDDYFIMRLDNKYCKPSSIEGGVYNFAFDFSYFDQNNDELNVYPPEFKRKYLQYKSDKNKRWEELDSTKTVCFKTNIDTDYPLPMFSGMFPSIYDLEEYKKLKKDRAKNENYLLLHQRIPMDEKNPDLNKFLIDLDLANYFHNAASENLPDGIEVVTSPMELTAVKTEKSKNDNDYVLEAMREVYNDGGISQFLFNSDKSTSVGLSKSINTDEEIAFGLLRQMETWVNRKLKQMFSSIKCKFTFLNVTVFNQKDVAEMYLKQAQYGLPVKLEIAAVHGMTPLDVINKVALENDILGLHDLFIPLSSSHTQSGDGESESGRSEKDEDELSEAGQATRDTDGNDRRING